MSRFTVKRPALSTLFTLSFAICGALGCSQSVPRRPVPPNEAAPALPPWFPERPWTDTSGSRTLYEGKVVFNTGRSTIRPESKRVLEELLTWLQANPDVSRVRLEGHTDTRAGEEYNQGLSERRAIAVANHLVDNGLDHNRVLAVAFGEARPLYRSTRGAEARQENRRTSFHIAEMSGRAFGGDPSNGGLVLTVLSKAERDALAARGEVPVYVPAPVKVERDVFKPLVKPRMAKDAVKDLLQNKPKTVDAATGEDKEGK